MTTDDPDHVLNAVVLPPDAAQALRRHLGKPADTPLRIAYVPGPGDVVGTFDHWQQGRHDPRVPVITYSVMFYSLVHRLGAQALVLTAENRQPVAQTTAVTFRHVPRETGQNGFRYRLAEARYAKALAQVVNDWQPDITVVGSDAPAGLFHRLHVPAILSAHNSFWPMGQRPRNLRARLALLPRIRSLRHVAAALCTSAECAHQIVAVAGSKPTFVEVPQVVSTDMPPSVAPPRDVAHRITFIGRIEENKGVFDLLTAVENLAAFFPSLSLTFAGDGTASANLATAAGGSSLGDRVRLLGRIDSGAVHALLDVSDIVVCPTRSNFNEGLAMVVVEAAIHGRPCVISSVVPAGQLFPDSCSIFAADDAAALQTALRRLIEDPATLRRMSEQALRQRHTCLDRRQSWGSQLYLAFLETR